MVDTKLALARAGAPAGDLRDSIWQVVAQFSEAPTNWCGIYKRPPQQCLDSFLL
jgi:hypothetical protein